MYNYCPQMNRKSLRSRVLEASGKKRPSQRFNTLSRD